MGLVHYMLLFYFCILAACIDYDHQQPDDVIVAKHQDRTVYDAIFASSDFLNLVFDNATLASLKHIAASCVKSDCSVQCAEHFMAMKSAPLSTQICFALVQTMNEHLEENVKRASPPEFDYRYILVSTITFFVIGLKVWCIMYLKDRCPKKSTDYKLNEGHIYTKSKQHEEPFLRSSHSSSVEDDIEKQ